MVCYVITLKNDKYSLPIDVCDTQEEAVRKWFNNSFDSFRRSLFGTHRIYLTEKVEIL